APKPVHHQGRHASGEAGPGERHDVGRAERGGTGPPGRAAEEDGKTQGVGDAGEPADGTEADLVGQRAEQRDLRHGGGGELLVDPGGGRGVVVHVVMHAREGTSVHWKVRLTWVELHAPSGSAPRARVRSAPSTCPYPVRTTSWSGLSSR